MRGIRRRLAAEFSVLAAFVLLLTAAQVAAQDPPPQTRTSEVRLLVNRGEDRASYVMPDLIGVSGDRAADLLRTRGFRVTIVARQSTQDIPAGVVIRQTPAGGYQVHPGDAISLEVSQ